MVRRKKTKSLLTKFFILLTTFGVFFACTNNDPKSLKKSDLIQKSNTLLDQWHLAASEANYANYFNKMDSVSVFIGTDASENWTKKEFENFSKPYFDKGKAWSFKAIERNIYTSEDGSFIWFDELLSTWMGICRGSGILEMKDNTLKIKHYVLSVTVPNDDIQNLITIKKEKDSLFVQKLTSSK